MVVKHTYYLSDDGSVAVDEDESSVAAQYVVNAHRWDPSSLPLPVQFNSTGQPADYGTSTIIQNAIATWNAVTPSTFSFTWGGAGTGSVGACGGSITLDGHNTVKFEPLPGLTLGQTCTVWNVAAGANAKLVEFDMQLDADVNTWSGTDQPQAGKYDIASTILHELGHAAGLGHSGQSAAVMYPTLPGGVAKRSLTADDISGLQAAYPGGAPATPTSVAATASPTSVGPLPPTFIRARLPLVATDKHDGAGPLLSVTPAPSTAPTSTRTPTPTPTSAALTPPAGGGCLAHALNSDWDLCVRTAYFDDIFEIRVTPLTSSALDSSFKVRVSPPAGLWDDSLTKYPTFAGLPVTLDYGFDFFVTGPYEHGEYRVDLRVDSLKVLTVYVHY